MKTELDVHVTLAVVAVPVSSTSTIPLPLAPAASFQLDLETTPATSVDAMGTSVPTKSMLITSLELIGPVAPTTRLLVAERLRLPLVPVIVRVDVPVGVVLVMHLACHDGPPPIMCPCG